MTTARTVRATICASAGIFGALVAGISAAPAAHAYDSWCDLIETHAPRIALVSEPLRTGNDQLATDRLNDFYTKVIPQLNTVASATFWYPNVWGSPDIRSDTRTLMDAMTDLRGVANDSRPAGAQVAAVDDALATLHRQCAGRRGLPPRNQQ